MSRCKPITTRLTFAVAGKRNRIKPLPLAFGRGAGWSNAPSPGSIVPAACWCVGQRRPKIIWLSFIWLVLNSFSTKFWFSDKLLVFSRQKYLFFLRNSGILQLSDIFEDNQCFLVSSIWTDRAGNRGLAARSDVSTCVPCVSCVGVLFVGKNLCIPITEEDCALS